MARKPIWQREIELKCGDFGWDFLIVHKDGPDRLIQMDQDYPGVARTFGWRGLTKAQIKKAKCKGEDDYACLERAEIGPAGNWLSANCRRGKTASDPGYFSPEDFPDPSKDGLRGLRGTKRPKRTICVKRSKTGKLRRFKCGR